MVKYNPNFSSRQSAAGTRNKSSRMFRKKVRKYRTKASRIPKQVVGLSRQVKELKRLAESDMGTHTQRHRQVDRMLVSENQATFRSYVGNSVTEIESVLAQLRYYDPSNPGTLINASGAAGTFQKDFYFTRVFSHLVVRNNYQVPCRVNISACIPKADTSLSPSTALSNGLADIGNPSASSPLVYFSDSPQFRDLWMMQSSKRKLLEAGGECHVYWSGAPFQYDPSLTDSHSQSYQARNKAMVWAIKATGVIAHDSVADQQGIMAAGLDVMVDTTFQIKYPAGVDLIYLHIEDDSSLFTTGPLISNKPIADNQNYSSS